MRLYYFADACSLATHIALIEAGHDFEAIRVDAATRITEDGRPFAAINAKGYVPALELDDGTLLTENTAILDWIAEGAPVLLCDGGMPRTRQIEALAFMTTEIHKPFLALFFMPVESAKSFIRQQIAGRFDSIAARMDGEFLGGARFGVADAFLYVMLRWARDSDMDLPAPLPAYFQRLDARPSVRAALAAESLA